MDKDLAGLYNHFRLTEEEDEIVDMSNVSDQVGAFLLAGRVLSSKPLNPNSLSAAFRELWRTEKNFKLFEIGNEEMFVVEFESERDRDRVLEDGPWSFDSQLAILGELSGDEQPSKLKMDHCNFWVWFCDLPFNCRNKDAISLIGSKIGRVVQIEISNNWGNFVKVRISINISKPLMRGIRIMNSKREIIWVYFRYEKLSNYCYWCGVIGHVHENCDKIRAEMVELDEEGNSNWPYGSSLCASNGGEEGDDRSSGDVKEINQLDAEEISGPNVEEERLKKLQMLDEENQALKSSFINVHLSSDERDIGRLIRQISGSKKNVSESDDSDYELSLDGQSYLMDKVGMVEGALFELSQEHQVGVKEEIRNKISELEMELMQESEKSDSVVRRVEKYREAKESERKFDTQYQRKIAEALDNYLTAIQRDHELKSQIEERRTRSDAAHEEAKRREKALQEERLYQERVRAEAEAKGKAEEAKMVALEAERKAAKEAAEKEAAKLLCFCPI